jgi:hypothetical protein
MMPAIEAVRNKEMGSYETCRPLNLYFTRPSITTEHLVWAYNKIPYLVAGGENLFKKYKNICNVR